MDSNSFFDSTLYVNLPKIKQNYLLLKKKSGGAICAATVKANAYGLGIEEVSNCLSEAGCQDFFVATLGEAIKLRRINSNARIYVLHGIKESEHQAFLGQDLIPVTNSLEEIKSYNLFAAKKKLKLPFIMHFDTGINRLGISEDDINEISNSPKLYKNLDLKYIFSHLSCSNEIDNVRNQIQLDKFKDILKKFPKAKASLSNSSAIFLGKKYIFDMVRPGAALFGIHPCSYKNKNPMHNVINLHSKIIQIKTITENGMIGYGNVCPIKKGAKIAIIPVGYADGYLRSLTNRSYCHIKGYIVPTLGKISMDMTILDISKIPANKIKTGDEVELIGDNIDLSNLAMQAKTIAYEILTSFGDRFKKIYIRK
jgi:alanine racemase